jgi:hypothetical protein
MKFEPKPENDFQEFIDIYFERCRVVCTKLRVIAGKWEFDDLIPGMSDFDARFIFSDDVTVREWMDMSMAVGDVHTRLAKEQPRWARILEHLPGVNLTKKEIINPLLYYPEFRHWTFYNGDQDVRESIETYLARKIWSRRDELFHLKKFALYYGPYQQGIDPPVNMGKWKNKYPLHSRLMHYFTPPLKSAVSLVIKRGFTGKGEALRQARRIFPNPEVIDMIIDTVQSHYEIQSYYSESKITEIERLLVNYLRDVYRILAEHVTLIDVDIDDSVEELKAKVAAVKVDPADTFFEGVRFSRFMKGRLIFYATKIDWFDTNWLIRNELGRIVNMLFEKPLPAFMLAKFKEKLSARQVLESLHGNILTTQVYSGVKRFLEVASMSISDGEEKKRAREVADVFEPVQIMVEKLADELRGCL